MVRNGKMLAPSHYSVSDAMSIVLCTVIEEKIRQGNIGHHHSLKILQCSHISRQRVMAMAIGVELTMAEGKAPGTLYGPPKLHHEFTD